MGAAKRALSLILAICFVMTLCPFALAAELIRKEPVLAVFPVIQNQELEPLCSQAIYDVFKRSRAYQVLPDWYVLGQLTSGNEWQNDWEQAFEKVPQAEQIVLLRLQAGNGARGAPANAELSAIWLSAGEPPEVVRVETLSLGSNLALGCNKMALTLLGTPPVERFLSPPLSASLSLVVPGAGHFYRATPEGVLIGSGFLAAYLGIAFLGFSDLTDPYVTRSQWGGMLLFLSLIDVLSAYFMTEQR